jgi:adenylate kinase
MRNKYFRQLQELMRIILTGTPGTGKTSVAEALGKALKLPVTNINDVVKTKKLAIKHNKARQTSIVDLKKLRKELLKHTGIIEGHLACEFSLPGGIVFVLRCEPHKLLRRMAKRGYSRAKMEENALAEALDYCTIVAEKHYSTVIDVDTTKRTVKQTAKRVEAVLRHKAKPDKVNWVKYLEEQ